MKNDKKYLKAFERMRDYFSEKSEEYLDKKASLLIKSDKFDLAYKNFCKYYSVILGSEPPPDLPNLEDWLTFYYQYNQDDNRDTDAPGYEDWLMAEYQYALDHNLPEPLKPNERMVAKSTHPLKPYWKMVIDRIEKSPNPLMDEKLLDFIQLMQINYTLTQKKEVIDQLSQIGSEIFTRHITWRREENSKLKNVKWPNYQVYKDQKVFLNVTIDIKKAKNTLKYKDLVRLHANRTIEEQDSDDDIEKEYNWFRSFYYGIYPIYLWFFIYLLGKHNWDKSNIETIKYWLYLINESIYEATNIFSMQYPITTRKGVNYPEKDLNQKVLGRYGWQTVGKFPNIPI